MSLTTTLRAHAATAQALYGSRVKDRVVIQLSFALQGDVTLALVRSANGAIIYRNQDGTPKSGSGGPASVAGATVTDAVAKLGDMLWRDTIDQLNDVWRKR